VIQILRIICEVITPKITIHMKRVYLQHVCRPAGWDNEKKIAILYDGMNSMKPDDAYNDVITRPVVRKVDLI